jgi:hypothetical protein
MCLPLITWLLQNVFLDILNHPLISGLKLDKQILLFVSVFSDADWTGDLQVDLSVFLGSNLISWSAKK